jgi:hypothetical protein
MLSNMFELMGDLRTEKTCEERSENQRVGTQFEGDLKMSSADLLVVH